MTHAYVELIDNISRPVFNYMMKRIKKEILENEEFKELDANQFYNILIACISTIDVNLIRYIETFHKIKANSELNTLALKESLFNHINQQLKVLLK